MAYPPLYFVSENPRGIYRCFWVAYIELDREQTLAFGINSKGEPTIYLYSTRIRHGLTDGPTYVQIDGASLDLKNLNLYIGQTATLTSLVPRLKIEEHKLELSIGERDRTGTYITKTKINKLETNLLKAQMNNLSRKIKAEIEEIEYGR
jgi:hypothetical protein